MAETSIHLLRIGQIFRDKRPKSPTPALIDGLTNLYAATACPGKKLVPFDAGINPIASVSSSQGTRRGAILIASSPHKSGSALTPWEDLFSPDEGYVRYFGDAKIPGRTASSAPGNALLTAEFEQHHGAQDRAGRLGATPLVFFRRQPHEASKRDTPDFRGSA